MNKNPTWTSKDLNPRSVGSNAEGQSASRPLMGFGELNDNMIKGLTILLKMS